MYTKDEIIDFCNKCGSPIFKKNTHGGDFKIIRSCKCHIKNKVHPALRVNTPPKSKL